jgi:hypothetical protein
MLRDTTFLEGSPIFGKIESLLIRHGGMWEIIRGMPTRSLAYDDIIGTVIGATLRWNKPFELFRIKSFIDGRQTSATAGADCSGNTIRRGLNALCKEGILCKLVTNNGRDVFYALNLEVIMARLKKYIDGLSFSASPAKTARRLYSEIVESDDYRRLVQFIKHFSDRVTANVRELKKYIEALKNEFVLAVSEVEAKISEAEAECKDVVQALKSIPQKSMEIVQNAGGAVVAKVLDTVNKAKQFSQERTVKKEDSKAGRSIIKESGFLDAEAALALWHKEVRNAGYATYHAKSTRKMHGQMKHWLIELVENGCDEKEIRGRIHRYTNAWRQAPRNGKDVQGVSKEGRPYMTAMTPTPDFDFFFPVRSSICHRLEETAARIAQKTSERREREEYDRQCGHDEPAMYFVV